MKVLSFSQLCLVVAITLGSVVAWCVATPSKLTDTTFVGGENCCWDGTLLTCGEPCYNPDKKYGECKTGSGYCQYQTGNPCGNNCDTKKNIGGECT